MLSLTKTARLVRNRSKTAALIASTVLMAQLGGCAGTGGSSSQEQFDKMITRRTEYFLQGPQQASPADGKFDEGTRIRILEPAGDYVKVETAFGKTAFVSTNDIGPIPEDKK